LDPFASSEFAMTKRLVPALLILLGGCSERSYNGKPLSYYRQQLQGFNQTERWRAAAILGTFGPDAAVAVPELNKAIQSDDTILRFEAARALGSIGPAAREAIPALKELLKDDNRNVRGAAEFAIKAIDKEPETGTGPK
jgi:HEAT repeat protein